MKIFENKLILRLSILTLLLISFIIVQLPKNALGERIDYLNRIQHVIFDVSCIGCHGKFGVAVRNVNLTSYAKIVEREGLIVPENPEGSLLYRKVMTGHGGLSVSEIKDLQAWIIQGANEY